jgi:two-component system, NarL family, response regulator LiaR
MTVRILLIDDHPVVRTDLRAILESELDLDVHAEDASHVGAIQDGAIGYVLETADAGELVRSIRSAAAEGTVRVSPRAAVRFIDEMRSPSRRNHVLLTHRQREVLRALANGQTNKEIARSLDIALTTVKSHVRSILNKLGVDSRTQAALYAVGSRVSSDADLLPSIKPL